MVTLGFLQRIQTTHMLLPVLLVVTIITVARLGDARAVVAHFMVNIQLALVSCVLREPTSTSRRHKMPIPTPLPTGATISPRPKA